MNPVSDGRNKRLMVVDDDALVRASVCHALVAAGYTVSEAAEGEEALRLLDESPADGMVIDIFMPNKDGLELIRDVRRKWPGMRIVAISGGQQGNNRNMLSAAQKFGAGEVLDKPFLSSDLVAAVKRILAAEG